MIHVGSAPRGARRVKRSGYGLQTTLLRVSSTRSGVVAFVTTEVEARAAPEGVPVLDEPGGDPQGG